MENKEVLYRAILDAIPLPVMLVDDDVKIVDLNRAALELVNKTRLEVLYIRGGDALACVHAGDVPEGCGRGPHCSDCVIRNSVNASMAGAAMHRHRTKAELVSADAVKEIDLLVTTAPLDMDGQRLVLLILEDVSELTNLRTLIPMCSKCRRIRDDKEYWQSVEEYFKSAYNADVTHSLCLDCLRELYPEHSESIIRNLAKRRNGRQDT